MDTDMQNASALKQQAGTHASQFVESGMVVGLGHGSTAIFAARSIAQKLREGILQGIVAVPCSRQVEADALRLGIPLTTLDEHPQIDLTIDGADEVDPHLNLIKGGGGALLREKIVAQASRREIIVVDESKLSPALGTQWPVPVEVVAYGLSPIVSYVESLGARPVLRQTTEGLPFTTDQGNLILDCYFGPISDPGQLADQLKQRAGIAEHGIFIALATDVVVGSDHGIRHLRISANGSPGISPG